ncbi:SDR family NAD(P)-dependent oxidoreductase [Pacificoceanicola onchidii]|uniref:SDR family NAD(P)-dependent oxidoreductase n=1 Tax=Pacificoceanicola onchidii TaxID=2562685 RepID=UPI00198197DE|nr:SDR family oxidoreductase [Pacificoceanicola onchidii]
MATCVITGGGTGIGAATANAMHAAGQDVIALGLDQSDELTEAVPFVRMDLSDTAAVQTFFADLDGVSALVNCAGILRQQREWETEHFSTVLDINLTAVLACCTAARPALTRSGGAIVNIASMWSFFGSPGSPGYAASKAGIVALTRSLATAWAQDGIRANAVAPGWIATRMAENARMDLERSAKINARIPMGRWGEPSDVAKVICFLASSEARYVTGAVLPIDGGYSIA